MKNLVIGAIIGGLILWVWQFLSWSLLNIHGSQMAHTSQQDVIMEKLAELNLPEGEYFLPRAPIDASGEEQAALGEKMLGQPWALLKYRKSFNVNMGMNMGRALLINLLAVFILAWIMSRFAQLDMKTALMTSIGVGLIGYFTVSYLNSIWFNTDSIPELIDVFVSWGLVGAFLGWWLTRGRKTYD